MTIENPSGSPSGMSPKVFDPKTDTVYDLELGVSKRITFLDKLGNPLRCPTGQTARLFHLWNAAAKGMMSINPGHSQVALAEGVMGLLGREISIMGDEESRAALQLMHQFCIGLGLYLSRHQIKVDVVSEKMSEAQIAQIRKKFHE